MTILQFFHEHWFLAFCVIVLIANAIGSAMYYSAVLFRGWEPKEDQEI